MEEKSNDAMTFEQVVDYVDKLLSIDSDNLDAEALRATRIFADINRLYIKHARRLSSLINQRDRAENARYRFYTGKMPAEHYKKEPLKEALLKTDIPQYMNIDPIVIEIRTMVAEEERIVKFLEESKKTLGARGFDIKTAVEFRKMMMGM